MIKILSSFNIIKNGNLKREDMKEAVIDTELDFLKEDLSKMIKLEKDNIEDVENLDNHNQDEEENLKMEKFRDKANYIIDKESYIKDLEIEKVKMIEEARQEIEDLKQAAKELGFKEGLKKGEEEGYKQGIINAKQEADSIKKQALDLVSQAENYVYGYYKDSEKDIIGLAIDIAESIVRYSIDRSDEGLSMLIKGVIEEHESIKNIIIRCSPANKDKLKDNLSILEKEHPETKFFIIKDSNLGDYDCILETDDRVIDLSIGEQLESVLDTIRNVE